MKMRNILLVLAVLVMAACKPAANIEPTQEPFAVYTSAAKTVVVQLTQNAQKLPSVTATQTITPTQIPTETRPTATVGSTATAAPTVTQTMPTTQDRVEYLLQNPSDGVVLAPSEAFTVSWDVKNVGQTTWTTGYAVRFFSGSRIGAGLPNAYTFTREVLPGDTYTVTAEFKTGSELGEFQSNWVLTNKDGSNFYPLYISIRVENPTATPTLTQTLEPTEAETVTPEP